MEIKGKRRQRDRDKEGNEEDIVWQIKRGRDTEGDRETEKQDGLADKHKSRDGDTENGQRGRLIEIRRK